MTYIFSNEEEKDIKDDLSKFFKIKSVSHEGPVLIFKVEEDERFDIILNSALEYMLDKGYNLYNSGSDEIIVARRNEYGRSQTLKLILLLLTVLTIFYAGASYAISYYVGQPLFLVIMKSTIYFLLPVLAILASRELPKYIIRKKSGQKYTLPLFIPNPIIMGTMGLINAPDEPYKTSDDQFFSGFFSLISGFIVSMVFLSMGYYGVSIFHGLDYGPNSSVSLVNLPLLFQAILGRFLPAQGEMDPFALAGWAGLIFTSFNAFPVGFLDGAYIFSTLSPATRKNISYIFITIMAFIDLTYPVWFILPFFILLVGLDVQEPMNTAVRKINRKTVLLIIVTLLIAVVGLTPFPVHISSPSIEISTEWDSAVVLGNITNSACFQINVVNSGQIPVDPGFYIPGGIPYDVKALTGDISPGQATTYKLTINSSTLNYGQSSLKVKIYVNSASSTIDLKILKIRPSDNISLVQIPHIGNSGYNITVSNSQNETSPETMFISAPENLNYSFAESMGNDTSPPQYWNGTYIDNGIHMEKIPGSKETAMNINITVDIPQGEFMEIAFYDSSYIGNYTILY